MNRAVGNVHSPVLGTRLICPIHVSYENYRLHTFVENTDFVFIEHNVHYYCLYSQDHSFVVEQCYFYDFLLSGNFWLQVGLDLIIGKIKYIILGERV